MPPKERKDECIVKKHHHLLPRQTLDPVKALLPDRRGLADALLAAGAAMAATPPGIDGIALSASSNVIDWCSVVRSALQLLIEVEHGSLLAGLGHVACAASAGAVALTDVCVVDIDGVGWELRALL